MLRARPVGRAATLSMTRRDSAEWLKKALDYHYDQSSREGRTGMGVRRPSMTHPAATTVERTRESRTMTKKDFERKEGETFEDFIRRVQPKGEGELQQAVADWMKDESPDETEEAAEAFRLAQAAELVKELGKKKG
jgi:uncharacterized protein HemY